MHKKYPDAKLVFSGGNNKILKNNHSEADIARSMLVAIGYGLSNVIFENKSQNTYENFLYSKDLVNPQNGENWIVITSAFHMPRAIGTAQKTGWDNIIAYPVDYRFPNSTKISELLSFKILRNFKLMNIVMHEYLGIIVYRFTEKMVFPIR